MRRAAPRWSAVIVLALCGTLVAGCVQPRYRLPAVLAATGAVLAASGATTMVAAPDDRGARVTSAALMGVGIAALLGAAVWLGLRIRCETALDCHEGETCQPVPTSSGQSYGMCAPASPP
jgi:hypothetical protein